MDSVFAGRMMFEAGLRGLTKRGPPSLQIQCVYDGSRILENFEKKYKAGGGGLGAGCSPPFANAIARGPADTGGSSHLKHTPSFGDWGSPWIIITTYLRHATLSGNSGSPYIFNTPPHSAITVHHIS